MATSKLNKRFFVLLIIVGLITIFVYFIKRISIDSGEIKICEESLFITGGKRTFIDFNEDYKDIELSNLSIISLKNKKEIKYERVNPENPLDKIFFFDEKVLKTDTLLIKLKNEEIRIYDFRNEGWEQKAGKDKGKFFCYNFMKINSVEFLLESDTIYLNGKNLNK
jgi:hypothetical protein